MNQVLNANHRQIEKELSNIDNLYFILMNKINKEYKNTKRRKILKSSPLSGNKYKIKDINIGPYKNSYISKIPYELKYKLLNDIMLKKYCDLLIFLYQNLILYKKN